MRREHEGDPEHRQRVERHPRRAVRLVEPPARRQVRAVDRADVVEPEEPALEDVVALRVDPVHPPGEVDEQLLEDALEEREVRAAVDLEDTERRERVHGRVHVVERPLVRGQRAVRVHEPLPAEQDQLVLRERRVDVREHDRVEGEVPGREPRVLPRDRHGQDVPGVEVPPARIPPREARRGGRGLARVAVEPAPDVVGVELLRPDHPREGLPQDLRLLGRRSGRGQLRVVLVRLALTGRERRVERLARPLAVGGVLGGAEPEPELDPLPGGHLERVPPGRLRPRAGGIHGRGPLHDVVRDPVLRVRRRRLAAEEARGVRLVLAQEGDGLDAADSRRREVVRAEARVDGDELSALEADLGPLAPVPPRPGVAEPERRQDVDRVGLGAGVLDGDPEEDVGRGRLRVRRLDRPVPVLVEDPRVEELVLGDFAAATRVLRDEVVVGERALRVVVAPAEPGMARRRVHVPPVLLGVLAVVPLRVREPEDPLLEHPVAPVPEREREAEPLVEVADAREPLLVPAVRARGRVVVREEVPGVPVRAVVLPHGAPGALGEVRAPRVPGAGVGQRPLGVADGRHPLALGAHVRGRRGRASAGARPRARAGGA